MKWMILDANMQYRINIRKLGNNKAKLTINTSRIQT